MNTAETETALDADDEGFWEQWEDLRYSCSQCEQLARVLVFIWDAIEDIRDHSQRKHGVNAAHFLAFELHSCSDNLEFDLQTLKKAVAQKTSKSF
jgi:hypothetical protein